MSRREVLIGMIEEPRWAVTAQTLPYSHHAGVKRDGVVPGHPVAVLAR
jgi:hypothetical protein